MGNKLSSKNNEINNGENKFEVIQGDNNLEILELMKNKSEVDKKSIELISETVNTVNSIYNNKIKSEEIAARTQIELKNIEENHNTINRHIENEYNKQKGVLIKSGEVVDKGLDSNNLDLVQMGLNSMVQVANHNPVADLKSVLDKNIEKDFNDDEYILEI